MNRLNPETIDQIFKLRSEGKSHREISQVLHVGRGAIGRYLNPERAVRATARRRENWTRTTINGKSKWFHVRKRPYPDSCELCGKKKKRYDWHHWDDEHLELGLWLCISCHKFAEGVEQDLLERYLNLKQILRERLMGLVLDRDTINGL